MYIHYGRRSSMHRTSTPNFASEGFTALASRSRGTRRRGESRIRPLALASSSSSSARISQLRFPLISLGQISRRSRHVEAGFVLRRLPFLVELRSEHVRVRHLDGHLEKMAQGEDRVWYGRVGPPGYGFWREVWLECVDSGRGFVLVR